MDDDLVNLGSEVIKQTFPGPKTPRKSAKGYNKRPGSSEITPEEQDEYLEGWLKFLGIEDEPEDK